MTTHLVTFSDESMSRAADLCIGSGSRNGCDSLSRFEYGPFTGSKVFEDNEGLFLRPRGLGYWAWKPVIIDWTLNNYREEYIVYPRNVKDGDIVVYADSGIEFIDSVNHIISRMDQDIFLFGNNWEHAHWCKRDVVVAIWPPPGEIGANEVWEHRFGKQAQASVIFFRVSDWSRAFVAEWLKWCLAPNPFGNTFMDQPRYLIDDTPSYYPNHPEFQEHRHDQAILTTMAYREGIKLHAWPAVYNRFLGQEFVYSREGYSENDNYPSLFHHHRLRNSEFEALGIKV